MSKKRKSRKQEPVLSFRQAILLGLIPALLTGALTIVGIVIGENREDDRFILEVGFTQTAEIRNTESAQSLAPGSPEPQFTPELPPTITPFPPEPSGDESPEKALIRYYELINQGEYLTAWNSLSDNFQFRFNDNDYPAFEAFWKSAGMVSVVEVVPEDKPTDFKAVLLVSLYWEADRRVRSNRFILIFDINREAWEIDEVGPVD